MGFAAQQVVVPYLVKLAPAGDDAAVVVDGCDSQVVGSPLPTGMVAVGLPGFSHGSSAAARGPIGFRVGLTGCSSGDLGHDSGKHGGQHFVLGLDSAQWVQVDLTSFVKDSGGVDFADEQAELPDLVKDPGGVDLAGKQAVLPHLAK